MTSLAERSPAFSFVLETRPASAEAAQRHFAARLSVETDPSDVNADLARGQAGFVVVDARSGPAFADLHLPGAVNLPARTIDDRTAAPLRGKVAVVYCWTATCNAATKAAARLSALGVEVKEMMGGIDAWIREGYPVEGDLPGDVPFEDYLKWHHSGRTGQFRR